MLALFLFFPFLQKNIFCLQFTTIFSCSIELINLAVDDMSSIVARQPFYRVVCVRQKIRRSQKIDVDGVASSCWCAGRYVDVGVVALVLRDLCRTGTKARGDS